MKQTAVQWYAIESGKLEVERAKGYLTFSQIFDKMLEILKQAKAMEKEQMILIYKAAFQDGFNGELFEFEKYYNETFKSE